MKENNLPSGLVDENIELFSTGDNMMATHSGLVKSIHDLPEEFLKALRDKMNYSPSIIMALKMSGYCVEKPQLEKFVQCNYGGFDLTADFQEGKLSDSEYHECGYRGECPMEGIVCSFFKIRGHIITPLEIEMIKLLATEDTLPVIAEKLHISMNTFDTKKQLLFQKMDVLSRARCVALAYEIQLLNPSLCSH